MTEEIIIDCIHKHYDSEICNAYSNNVFSWDCSEFNNCYYKQLKQAENTVNECHKYLAELEDKIERLEQENQELKELNKKICEDWEKEIKVYWNALEEIKEIAMGIMDDDIDEGSAYYDADQIINKINEVL